MALVMLQSFDIGAGVLAGVTELAEDGLAGWHIDFVINGVGYGVRPRPPARETVGSSVEAGEEVAFSAQTGLPVSGFLGVSEKNGRWEDWRHAPSLPIAGQLVLLDREPFPLAETDFRVLDPAGSALMGLMSWVKPSAIEGRCQVLPGLDFLVSQRRYCGWLLSNPVRRLRMPASELPSRSRGAAVQSNGTEAVWLSRLFELASSESLRLLQRGNQPAIEALEALGEEVDAAAETVAGWRIAQSIEEDLSDGLTLTRTDPVNLAVARDLVSGHMTTARDRAATVARVELVHPVIAERVRAERKLVELHRDLRRRVPTGREPGNETTESLTLLIEARSPVLQNLFREYEIPELSAGLSTWDQFVRLNDRLRAIEISLGRQNGSLGLRQWIQFQNAVGNHAEAIAVSEALLAMKTQPAAGVEAHEALQHLELHIERMDVQPPASAQPEAVPRCIHCSFITHGVRPTDEVLEKEREAARLP